MLSYYTHHTHLHIYIYTHAQNKHFELIIYEVIELDINLKSYSFMPKWMCERQTSYPYLGSKAIALGCSMAPAISVVLKEPSSLATSIWSRLLSIQYILPAIQSTVSPSGVARPCSTTTSIALTPATEGKLALVLTHETCYA